MNNKERVLACLSHQQPDRIPYNIGFTQKAYKRMVEFYDDQDFASRLNNCLKIVQTTHKESWKEIEPDIWEDKFGVRWNQSVDKDIGVVCNRTITLDNLKDYVFPDPETPSRYECYDRVIQDNADSFIVADIGFSLFERAWTLAGMENILMSMIVNPDFIHDLLDRILDYNLNVIANACSHDIDAMLFGDDWGQQTGLLMGPDLWRQFIKPRVAKMYQAVKERGKYVIIHSCGKVDEIFPDLIDIGLDMFNPFQPEVIDVFEIKMKYGETLSFYGGISTQKTLPFGTVQDVKDEVRRLIDDIGKGGGYIAAPAHAIPGDAKPENIDAMIHILDNQ